MLAYRDYTCQLLCDLDAKEKFISTKEDYNIFLEKGVGSSELLSDEKHTKPVDREGSSQSFSTADTGLDLEKEDKKTEEHASNSYSSQSFESVNSNPENVKPQMNIQSKIISACSSSLISTFSYANEDKNEDKNEDISHLPAVIKNESEEDSKSSSLTSNGAHGSSRSYNFDRIASKTTMINNNENLQVTKDDKTIQDHDNTLQDHEKTNSQSVKPFWWITAGIHGDEGETNALNSVCNDSQIKNVQAQTHLQNDDSFFQSSIFGLEDFIHPSSVEFETASEISDEEHSAEEEKSSADATTKSTSDTNFFSANTCSQAEDSQVTNGVCDQLHNTGKQTNSSYDCSKPFWWVKVTPHQKDTNSENDHVSIETNYSQGGNAEDMESQMQNDRSENIFVQNSSGDFSQQVSVGDVSGCQNSCVDNLTLEEPHAIFDEVIISHKDTNAPTIVITDNDSVFSEKKILLEKELKGTIEDAQLQIEDVNPEIKSASISGDSSQNLSTIPKIYCDVEMNARVKDVESYGEYNNSQSRMEDSHIQNMTDDEDLSDQSTIEDIKSENVSDIDISVQNLIISKVTTTPNSDVSVKAKASASFIKAEVKDKVRDY